MKIHNYYKLTSFIFIFFVLTINLIAANHYVDKNANGSNNGTSWSNAWESFSSINWSNISAGDIIYISGGNDSTIYNETLCVNKSGISGSNIFVKAGEDTGHNGTVIIEGGGSLSKGISVDEREYLVVSGFTVRNTVDGCIDVRYSNKIIVENCKIFVTGRAGVYLRQNTNSEVNNCTIITGSYVNTQTDGIYSQLNTNNVYHHNYIVVNNSEPTGHDDCIQSYQDNSLTVFSNYLEQNNNKTSNAQGLYATTPTGGTFKFYNNIVNMTVSGSNGMTFRRLTGTGTVEMIGNTVYGAHCATLLQTTETPDPVLHNNVIYSGSTAFGARLIDWAGNPSNINNNIIYVPNSNYVWNINGNSKSWSQWRAMGFDTNGKNSDPKFKDLNGRDFSLQDNSPGIDAGHTEGSPFNVDIMEITRPKGQAFDMGAFEYTTQNNDIIPPDVINALINNTTTVVINFSEALDQTSAQNISNYSINNGITVNSAVISSDGIHVTLTTSAHSFNQQYTVTVSNVTDLAGNLINPQANSASYLLPGDTTPPEVTGAILSAADTLMVSFSEALDQNSAENISNYSINNGITVSGAVLSNDGLEVTLVTSSHSGGVNYLLTVSNVKDLAGNIVSPEADTAGYSFFNDVTSPRLSGATLSGRKTVNVYFSEKMDHQSAENKNNYSINHGITITCATILVGDTIVSLTTSQESPDVLYTLTVNNVKDIAGNVISPDFNSVQYQKVGGGGGKHKVNPSQANAQWYQEFEPDRSIDGNYDPASNSRWAGILPMPDSITFDLNDIKFINEADFSFYRWDQGRIYHYSVQISLDNVHWSEVLTDITSSSSEWTVNEIDPVQARYIKLIALSNNESDYAGLWEAAFYSPDQATGTEIINRPSDYKLEQNYPNPFNPTTTIRYSVPLTQHIQIDVYNIIGQKVKELVNNTIAAGTYEIQFNASELPSGVYIYRLQADSYSDVKKMVLLK